MRFIEFPGMNNALHQATWISVIHVSEACFYVSTHLQQPSQISHYRSQLSSPGEALVSSSSNSVAPDLSLLP